MSFCLIEVMLMVFGLSAYGVINLEKEKNRESESASVDGVYPAVRVLNSSENFEIEESYPC